MNQNRLRLTIFMSWATALLLSMLAVLLAPLFSKGAILESQSWSLLMNVAGIYVPALSCLGGFWFPNSERKVASGRRLTRDRSIVALVITLGYLSIVFLLLVWPFYITNYANLGSDLQPGESLEERVTQAVAIAAMFSSLALLPVTFLTSTSADTASPTGP